MNYFVLKLLFCEGADYTQIPSLCHKYTQNFHCSVRPVLPVDPLDALNSFTNSTKKTPNACKTPSTNIWVKNVQEQTNQEYFVSFWNTVFSLLSVSTPCSCSAFSISALFADDILFVSSKIWREWQYALRHDMNNLKLIHFGVIFIVFIFAPQTSFEVRLVDMVISSSLYYYNVTQLLIHVIVYYLYVHFNTKI